MKKAPDIANAREPPVLEECNRGELLQILSKTAYRHLRIKASISPERLIQLIKTGEPPTDKEIAGTHKTRHTLQKWIDENWKQINSQLPCEGPNRGRCLIYPCSDGLHLDCYLSVQSYIL